MSNNFKSKLNNSQISILLKYLSNYECPSKNKHIDKFYKYMDWSVSLYKNRTLLIQGDDAESLYINIFEMKSNFKPQVKTNIENINDNASLSTIGSDEVGVGDFYGGLVVAAALVNPEDIPFLKGLGIKDSKLLTDEEMILIFNKIKDKIQFTCLEWEPIEYNTEYDKYLNSHILKAILHNRCLLDVSKKTSKKCKVIVDAFASEKNYYTYLSKTNEEVFRVDAFEQKAESKYIAVACASIIARVYFLNQIKRLEKTYNTWLPLGASNPKIKVVAKNLIKNNSNDILKYIAKVHFKTFNEIIGE
ncbi:MAG: ribonuclease HIII [Mycoplasma sp.]